MSATTTLSGERKVRGAVSIGGNSERVEDPDEEVFLIYSALQARNRAETETFRGLGHVDSRKDTILITFELKSPISTSPDTKKGKGSRRKKTQKINAIPDKTIHIQLSQDKTALRTRKGDTGSVLWKASIDFAHLVLQQIHFATSNSLLDPSILKTQHVIELGAGTGLLAIALSPYVQRYTATDIAALLPLIRKNVGSNFPGWPDDRCAPPSIGSNISVQELDWVLLKNTPLHQRHKVVDVGAADLILIVDCIYHPSLLPPLVETIDYLATSGRTTVLVIVELRAEDVVREFLEIWLLRPGWEIWRIDSQLDGPYAMWLGWRNELDS